MTIQSPARGGVHGEGEEFGEDNPAELDGEPGDEGEDGAQPSRPNRPTSDFAPQFDYKAWTTQFDEVVGAADLCDAEELARLRAAGLVLDTASYEDLQQRLKPITDGGGTYRHSAREMLALSAWRSGNVAAARQWLDLMANDGETPQGMRSRADALQALLPPVAKS